MILVKDDLEILKCYRLFHNHKTNQKQMTPREQYLIQYREKNREYAREHAKEYRIVLKLRKELVLARAEHGIALHQK